MAGEAEKDEGEEGTREEKRQETAREIEEGQGASTARESLSQEHLEDHSDKAPDNQRETDQGGNENAQQSPRDNGGRGEQENQKEQGRPQWDEGDGGEQVRAEHATPERETALRGQQETREDERDYVVEMQEDIIRQWTMADTAQAAQGNETMGLLWRDKTATGIRVEGLIIPPHERQAKTECVVRERETYRGAIQRGKDMGGCWLEWVHTYPNHVPLLSAQDVCSTNTLGILLRPILPEGRAPIAMVQSWISRGGCGVVNDLKAYKLTHEGQEAPARCASKARRAPGVPHDYHRHLEGVWDDDEPHPVTKEHSEVRIIITAHGAKCQTPGHNKWWMQQGGAPQQGTREGIEDGDHGGTAGGSPNSQGTEELEGIAAEHAPSETLREETGDHGDGKGEPRGQDRTSAVAAHSTDQETTYSSHQETTNSIGQGTANITDKETDTWSAGTATTLGPQHGSQKKKGKAGWAGPKHACGLCNRPVRRGQGAVQCGHAH